MHTDYNDEYSFIRPYLTAGETVLWRGKPQKGHLVTAQDIFMIPFSIMWCGFALFWEFLAVTSNAPFAMWLWGIPFVCVGLYMVFGRFLWTAYIRKRTAYVITNRKILRARGNRVDMLDGKNMPPVHVTARRDGSGTIRFGQNIYYRYGKMYHNSAVFTLDNVPDAARVQQAIAAMER